MTKVPDINDPVLLDDGWMEFAARLPERTKDDWQFILFHMSEQERSGLFAAVGLLTRGARREAGVEAT
jgi:hypothetical protein